MIKKRKKKVVLKHEPYMKLKGFMAENRIKQKVIAELLNLSVVTINQKINGRLEFTYSEVEKICDELGITTAFFNTKKVA